MNRIKTAIVSIVSATAITIAVSAHAMAAASAPVCVVKGKNQFPGGSFAVSGQTVTATFNLIGDDNCTAAVSLATWKAPNSTTGFPYKTQVLVDHKTAVFHKGTHTLTAQLPDCFWQADIVRGNFWTAPDGTAAYVWGTLADAGHGGSKKCAVKTTPQPPQTPPETPTPQSQPQTPTAPAAAPAVLPDTGAGSIVPIALGIGLTAGIAHRLRRKFVRS
jgi:hypothetical protein